MTQDTQAGAGAQPAPAQLPKTLRELAEVVHDWGKRDQAWAHPDPDCFDVALFGHISEDGERYPVAELNADTYGHEGVSLQLAQFYAAASPAAVLALLDRVELRDNELKAARADAKHWRSNHDNVVARLRIFTQRPDIPKELADRLPWYRELVRLQAAETQAAAKGLHQGADAEAVAALKGLLSLVRREAPQLSGKVLGDAESAIAALQAAPPAPAAVAVPESHTQALKAIAEWPVTDMLLNMDAANMRGIAQRALAAAPAQARAGITVDFKQATELLAMFGGEPAEITLIEGPGHSGEGLYAYYSDLPEEGAEFLGKPDNEALPAAPAQEHATQLAGQDWDRIKGGLSILMLGFAKRTSPTTLKAAEAVLDAATEPGAPLAMLRAAAPAQVQEGA